MNTFHCSWFHFWRLDYSDDGHNLLHRQENDATNNPCGSKYLLRKYDWGMI